MYGGRSPYAGMIQQQRGMAGGAGMGPGAGIRPAPRPQQQPRQKSDGGMGGMMSGMMGGMMSDERSKKEIERLDAQNQALTKALSSSATYPDTSAPSPGMQALGQQAQPSSSASFPDSPAANTVAAQNVALQQAGGAPAPTASPNPAFNVSRAMPNLAELDEAYKRLGAGGG